MCSCDIRHGMSLENPFQNFSITQLHMSSADVQNPFPAAFLGTFLSSPGYQKISTQILHSLNISLRCMLQKQPFIEVAFAAHAK